MEGGATILMSTVLLAEPVPPSVEEMAPVVLLASPAAVPCTSTFTVQEVFAFTVPPLKLMELLPATAVIVPAGHVVLALGVPATRRVPVAEGRVSLNAPPVRFVPVFG